MTRRVLAADVARCPGSGSDEEGWREGCEECLRRTSTELQEGVPPIEPPAIICFWCEYLLTDGMV